jgi:two-component system cell cycle sensor histidine kinase/response regulator CckA
MSRVLIMDDNVVIRNSAGKVLNRMGHEVQCAANGDEAIALYKQAQEQQCSFDVVILDLAIRGGMGGQEVLVHLRRLNAHVKAIVSSGYIYDPVVVEYAKHGFHGVLAKPYGRHDLAVALRQVLGVA